LIDEKLPHGSFKPKVMAKIEKAFWSVRLMLKEK